MLTITARDAESFSAIESALLEFDEQGVFLRYFDTAVQSEVDIEGVTVILRNSKKFKKDLNKKKYVISIPTTMTIDAFENIKKYETRSGKRVPFYSVLVKGHLTVSEVNFILILTGFNDDAIRVLSNDEFTDCTEGEDGAEGDSNSSLTNKQYYMMCNPPAPICHCQMSSVNCDEESFIVDTLIED